MINVDVARNFRRTRPARRCPACRHCPEDPYEHDDMLADLTVVWWVIARGRIRTARYCHECAPRTVFTSIDCAHCGDGPLVVLGAPADPDRARDVIDSVLSQSGWNCTETGDWICHPCQRAG
jgi:hypothetical protein